MIEFLRQLMILGRYVGLLTANKGHLSRTVRLALLQDYLKLRCLRLLPPFLISRLHTVSFLGHRLTLFDLPTTLSLIESIFLENEYYFATKNKSPLIIDLGSNIGLSVIYFKTLYPQSTIIAYEADPQTFRILNQNIASYQLTRVKLFNLAVAAKNGSIDFYIDRHSAGSPLMSIDPLRLAHHRKISVPCARLAPTIRQPIDFLKMDIEGAETLVLRDLDRAKKLTLIKQMFIEYHHHIDSTQDHLSQFLKVIEKNNFGYQIKGGPNTPFILTAYEDIQIHAYQKVKKTRSPA